MNTQISAKLHSAIDNETDFVLTDDGTTGLYSHSVSDIYHSSYGALSEAREKFIRPLNFTQNFNNNILTNKTIRVLDICSGIGYNSKAFLDYILKLPTFSGAKIKIDALEYNKRLVLLAPFINDGLKDAAVAFLLFNELKDEIFDNFDLIEDVILNKSNHPFFSRRIITLFEKYFLNGYNKSSPTRFNAFLHNIYYHYVSKRNKTSLKPSKILNFSFKPYYGDAREFIKSTSACYDIVFLDAFTPLKLPTLWSEEFFKQLYRIMSNDSLIVTYSNSAAVRNAMLAAGFFVGKTFDKKNRPSGTVASKNSNFISHPLDEFDLGLLKTNAGITFNDPELEWDAKTILERYNLKKTRLKLQSSSSYIKSHKNKKEKSCMTL